MAKLKCSSFFAGIGGIDIAFEENGFDVVYANEIDSNAAITLEKNNTKIKVDCRDINEVHADEIPDFDVMLAGFPCQAFSLAGYRQGFDDEKGRGTLFFELERIFRTKAPGIVFLENVKNLVGHDNGETFRTILEKLENEGYYVKYQILNAMLYGNIPQNRERIYILAFKNKHLYERFEFPKPIPLTTSISELIDFETKIEKKYYYTKENCSFYDVLNKDVTRTDTVYQWRRVYVRENKSNVCPTLTANMGTGGHNVPLIFTKHGIRKLTPYECFRLQGFPSTFIIPENLANSHAYKQAGNSVVVPVISRIAKELQKVLKEINTF